MKGVKCKRWKLAAEEERTVTSRVFSAYGRPLDMVISFRYLGRMISAADGDWPAVIRNLEKAQVVLRRMMRTLTREGEKPQVYRYFFKAVVQSVFIFCLETWVDTHRMGRVLGGFQDQVTLRLTSGSRGVGDV